MALREAQRCEQISKSGDSARAHWPQVATSHKPLQKSCPATARPHRWIAKAVVGMLLAFFVHVLYTLPPQDHVVDSTGKIHFLSLARPRLPLWLALFKSLLDCFYFALPAYSAADLLATAQSRTGLHDLGPHAALVKEGMARLFASMDSEARLNNMGKMVFREQMIGMLSGQLHLVDLINKHPEILQENITAPVVIAGLLRSGTTNLHNLLSASEDFRYLYFYEAAHNLQINLDTKTSMSDVSEPDPRIAITDRELLAFRTAAPMLPLMFNISATVPFEDISLESTMFVSSMFEAVHYVPSYATWVENADPLIMLRHIKQCLQAMQWVDRQRHPWQHRPPRPWVMKAPAHIERIPQLLEVFPDAVVVVTHRCMIFCLTCNNINVNIHIAVIYF